MFLDMLCCELPGTAGPGTSHPRFRPPPAIREAGAYLQRFFVLRLQFGGEAGLVNMESDQEFLLPQIVPGDQLPRHLQGFDIKLARRRQFRRAGPGLSQSRCVLPGEPRLGTSPAAQFRVGMPSTNIGAADRLAASRISVTTILVDSAESPSGFTSPRTTAVKYESAESYLGNSGCAVINGSSELTRQPPPDLIRTHRNRRPGGPVDLQVLPAERPVPRGLDDSLRMAVIAGSGRLVVDVRIDVRLNASVTAVTLQRPLALPSATS